MDVDCDGVSEGGGAGVCSRVGGARVLHHQEGRRHLGALVRDHAHAPARGVVRDDLKGEEDDDDGLEVRVGNCTGLG